MRLVVDRNRCQGIGMCEMAAADIIEVDEDGQAHVLVDAVAPEHEPAARVAVSNCPAEALLLQDWA
jgi:ferredoxin